MSVDFEHQLPVPLDLPIRGKRVHLATSGELSRDRPTLFAIHGAGGSHRAWGLLAGRLGDSFSFVAIDLPGHGHSEGPPLRSVGEMADLVAAVIEGASLRRVIPVGHSMGGAVAIELALRRPDLLEGLALVATGARLRSNPMMRQAMLADWERSCRMSLNTSFGPSTPEEIRRAYLEERLRTPAELAVGDFEACDSFDRMADVRKIALPTAIFGGDLDQLTPPKYTQYLADHIPNARLFRFAQAAHILPLEEPARIAAGLSEVFIDARAVTQATTRERAS